MNKVLVISPHPDDEAIGCGGTLRKHVLQGDTVRVIFLTSGDKGGHGRPPEETVRVRESEALAAAKVLGLSEIEFWREPDGALRATSALVHRLRECVQKWRPNCIYLPHDRERHPDHRAAVRLLRQACERRSGRTPHPLVWMFEVWTPLQRLDHIEDISSYIDVKLAAIRTYKSQCTEVGYPEAFRGLARYRGEMHSWPGGNYAEAYARLCLEKVDR